MTAFCERAIEGPAPRPVLTTGSDHDFVRQLQAGNELAYRALVERYQTRVLRLAYGILQNRGEAEEIAQLVFVKVFRSIRSFSGRSSLFAWIHRIATNECYSALRKRGLEISMDSSDPDVPTYSPQTLRQPGPPFDVVVAQRDYLNRLLASLPERDRQLLLLREVEGFSISELAEATGVNENLVKIRLFRARQRLVQAAGLPRRRISSDHERS